MEREGLIRARIVSGKDKIGITCFSDLAVLDKDKTIVALRIGGYPESVQAMSDIIIAGCDMSLEKSGMDLRVSSKSGRKYQRRISHDGIYAEAFHYLTDDIPQSLLVDANDKDAEADRKIAVDKNLYFFCKNDDELFGELDRKLSVPLIPEFKDYFLSELRKRDMLCELDVYSTGDAFSAYRIKVSQEEKEAVSVLEDGLKTGKISIPNCKTDGTDAFKDISSFTEYLHSFSSNIAEKIKECFPPGFDPSKEQICSQLQTVNRYVTEHAGYSLFDAQLAAAEALKRQLQKDNLALLVAECGTGKTKIGSAAVYAYQHSSPERADKKAFNVVICPSHITEKWIREIYETLPDCYAFHVNNMEDVDKVYGIYLRENKTVYCILSKETARNGYLKKPGVVWNPVKKGFVCPLCDGVQEMTVMDCGSKYTVNADAAFFLKENNHNHKCQYCKQPLWGMYNPYDLSSDNQWIRIGGYGYVHRKFLRSAYGIAKEKKVKSEIRTIIENPKGVYAAAGAYARFPISSYIKRKIGRIDALIVDELHQYSGESAQGQAMAELAGIADKVVGMTATLINGYAKGIFYLLFRMKAHLMLLDGYSFGTSGDFCHQYGVVEELFELEEKTFNSTTRAVKRKTREKFLPGLSPIVYSRFLLENTVFLSLADMGKELPDYEEIPVNCKMTEETEREYRRLESEFKQIFKSDRQMANKILSVYLNLLSAYPDQPYGHEPIYNPFFRDEKEKIIVPQDTGKADELQPKDEAVLNLIREKVANEERVIVYTAWTRLDTQTKLCRLLNEEGIKTAILDVSVPTVKREKWVDKRLKEGVKVLIVNPALVETGCASVRA